jgi:hypothetical protein
MCEREGGVTERGTGERESERHGETLPEDTVDILILLSLLWNSEFTLNTSVSSTSLPVIDTHYAMDEHSQDRGLDSDVILPAFGHGCAPRSVQCKGQALDPTRRSYSPAGSFERIRCFFTHASDCAMQWAKRKR